MGDANPLRGGQPAGLGLAFGQLTGQPVEPLRLVLQPCPLFLELCLGGGDLGGPLVVLGQRHLLCVTDEEARELFSERFDLDSEDERSAVCARGVGVFHKRLLHRRIAACGVLRHPSVEGQASPAASDVSAEGRSRRSPMTLSASRSSFESYRPVITAIQRAEAACALETSSGVSPTATVASGGHPPSRSRASSNSSTRSSRSHPKAPWPGGKKPARPMRSIRARATSSGFPVRSARCSIAARTSAAPAATRHALGVPIGEQAYVPGGHRVAPAGQVCIDLGV